MACSTRDETIYELRRSGVKYVEISKRYDISICRARQIFVRMNGIHGNAAPPLKKHLSMRLQNALRYFFKDDRILEKPEKILTLKPSEIRRIPCIGEKSVLQLVDALILLGYCRADDSWLQE